MQTSTNQKNWAGNITYGAARLHTPQTIAELQEIVARSERAKALGSRHSFSDVADTMGDLISLDRLDRVIALDKERRTVTIEAGTRYGELSGFLDREGYALHNLASLPHISVVGACATATHGSGDGNRCLATAVTALEMLTASGETMTLSRERDGDIFAGAVVSLGALGVVTTLTLDIVPRYAVSQVVYENLPLASATEHFDAIMASGYSVSLFTDWKQRDAISQVWRKERTPDGARSEAFQPEPVWFGAKMASEPRHPISGMPAENCTAQGASPGPWHERLPHFRMDHTPSSGEELQTEYLVPRPQAVEALQAVAEMQERIAPLLQVCEIRSIAADDLWLSPCYGQPCVGIHFTWRKDWPAVRALLPEIEKRLAPFTARPHWGKLFTLPPERLRPLYPRLPDFQKLMRRFDPGSKFRNGFLDRYIA